MDMAGAPYTKCDWQSRGSKFSLCTMGYTTEINSVILKRVLKRGPSQGGDFGGFNISMFGRTVNPISTRGADYAHHSTTSPLKFSDLATALPWQTKNIIHIPLWTDAWCINSFRILGSQRYAKNAPSEIILPNYTVFPHISLTSNKVLGRKTR